MWVVTLHECSGSTAEAIDVALSLGGFTSEQEADKFAQALYAAMTKATGQGYSEWYTQHFEVPDIRNIKFPPATSQQLQGLGPQPPDSIGVDMDTLAKQILERWDKGDRPFEMLPPAPAEDEVEAAIASITGGCKCDIDYLDPNCHNPIHVNPPEGF